MIVPWRCRAITGAMFRSNKHEQQWRAGNGDSISHVYSCLFLFHVFLPPPPFFCSNFNMLWIFLMCCKNLPAAWVVLVVFLVFFFKANRILVTKLPSFKGAWSVVYDTWFKLSRTISTHLFLLVCLHCHILY